MIKTWSELPADYLLTIDFLESANLDPPKIISIICPFDVSKAHGWDDVSLGMIEIYDEFLVKSFFNIFKLSLKTGNFWSNWKRDNSLLEHKKGNKDLINSYRPVSLPTIFNNFYEKCMYETFYNYLEVNDLFFMSQFGVVNVILTPLQLFSITHEIIIIRF